jgi:hypothetical protein
MPNFLSTLKKQRLKEEYCEYCLESILHGREAKSFAEFQDERAGSSWMKSIITRRHRYEG